MLYTVFGVQYGTMDRRSFLTVTAALPLLTTNIAEASNEFGSVGEEILQMRILHAEEKASRSRSFQVQIPPGKAKLWAELKARSFTEKGRHQINHSLETVNSSRLDWLKYNPGFLHCELVQATLRDLAVYFEYRRYQRFMGNPVPSLRTEPKTIRKLRTEGLVTGEHLCSPATWSITCYLCGHFGWDTMNSTLGLSRDDLPRDLQS